MCWKTLVVVVSPFTVRYIKDRKRKGAIRWEIEEGSIGKGIRKKKTEREGEQ